jgi:hypothetical protein
MLLPQQLATIIADGLGSSDVVCTRHQPNSQVCSSLYYFDSTHIFSLLNIPKFKITSVNKEDACVWCIIFVSLNFLCFSRSIWKFGPWLIRGKQCRGIEGLILWTDSYRCYCLVMPSSND